MLLTGCATTAIDPSRAAPVPSGHLLAFQEATAERTATLVVTRDEGMIGMACRVVLAIDGVPAGRFSTGETAMFRVAPGERVLRSGLDGAGLCAFGRDNWTQRETTLRPGETKHFRISIDPDGKVEVQRGD